MDIAAAEITKYAANAMLATRISFMNTIAQLCAATGADVDMVRRGIGSDSRIGSAFLFPGVGYGGSCFPKDVKALVRTMRESGADASILEAVESVNETQKRFLLERVLGRFGEDLNGRRFAVWGLAFKPNTDDMREAPSLVTIPALLARGAEISASDPVAMEEARRHFEDRITYHSNNYDALDGADALLIHTEWLPYRRPDFQRVRAALLNPIVFDGRNLYRTERMEELGFEYYSVGRRAVTLGRE
jgi:UDPglucose 6-dehydrogenase